MSVTQQMKHNEICGYINTLKTFFLQDVNLNKASCACYDLLLAAYIKLMYVSTGCDYMSNINLAIRARIRAVRARLQAIRGRLRANRARLRAIRARLRAVRAWLRAIGAWLRAGSEPFVLGSGLLPRIQLH
jgi:hypothetical protein